MKNRLYSLSIPWLMEAALVLVETAVPLFALRFGAGALLLGQIGWVPQALRLPVALYSGRISERTGRLKIMLPAALVIALAAVGLGLAKSNLHVMVVYALVAVAAGAFFPPLQAMIGDVSKRGELRKNLGAFNIGWCIGGAVAALGAAWLVGIRLSFAPYAGALAAILCIGLAVTWRGRGNGIGSEPTDAPVQEPVYPASLLFIARMGHFTGFFAFAIIRMLFPLLGKSLGWSDHEIAMVVAPMVIGMGSGMLVASASAWWRGKIWPQATAQMVILGCALVVAVTSSPVLLGAAFFGIGLALSTCYTAALYHSLSGRKSLGKNTGIHEALVSAGFIAGSVLGSLAAQEISPRAPYLVIACLAGICLITTAILSREHFTRRIRL